jgi:dihydrofolate reductase
MNLADDIDVVIVAAIAANGVIGRDGGMPWHHPEDLRQFKQLTTGHPVVMGRRTYESIINRIDGPLPDRTNVVLSRSELALPNGVIHADSVDAAIQAAAAHDSVVYVVGGATVYEAFLPDADRLVLSELDAAHEGDTYFPEFDRDAWVTVDREEYDAFDVVTYERK